MYNETLHDKTGSFLYQVSTGITALSDGAINDIRRLFASWNDLYNFIAAYVDVGLHERLSLCDQVFPLHDA